MKKLIFLSLFLITLISCESDNTRMDKAKEKVSSFMSNLMFDNYDLMYKAYPDFKKVKSYWKLKDFKIKSCYIDEQKVVTVIGESGIKQVLFEIKKVDGNYFITKSKGLCSDFESELYKFCKKIGCIGTNSYDSEISEICGTKQFEFSRLVQKIKDNIEENVILENHTVTKNYGWLSGDVTLKNYSIFSIPGRTYSLYINYIDGQGNIVFTSKEVLNFDNIPYNQSKTIHVFESNSNSFQKIGIKLKLTSTDFIESVLAENAQGYNCSYSNNL